MVRHPSPAVAELSRAFECVRVTDMAGVDLDAYAFDYDLTFAFLFLAPDGTILHHYGNRDGSGAESHLSMESLAAVMSRTLEDVKTHEPAPVRPVASAPRTVEGLPTMARRVAAGKGPECFHCHMIFQADDEEAREKGRWDPRIAWRWPDSSRIGVRTERDRQTVVARVEPGSPAAAAKILPGDTLLRIAGRPVASEGDVQAALEPVPWGGGRLAVSVARGGTEQTLELLLPDGWRRGAPLDMAWRASMWRLDPKPGFGGKALTTLEKQALGIQEEQFAFRVGYLVTWGENAHTGRNARDAGLRKGDVVVSVDGKTDFVSEREFHAWFRLTRAVGSTVEVGVRRDRETLVIRLPVTRPENRIR